MKFVLVAAAVTALCACGTKRNEERCLEGLCSDPDLPFCDVDGTIGGTPNACVAVDCTPGEFASCRGDRALTCNTTGDNYDLVQCANGCDANGCKPCTTPECEKHIIPKYLPTICDQLLPGDPITITQDTTIDTTNDQSCSSVVTQAGEADICVLRYSALTVDTNRTLAFVGARVVALVVDRDLTVAGVLDVSANAAVSNGPGGGLIRSGTCTGTVGGCGGAGNRTAAGSGGGSSSGANGGTTQPQPAQLAVLRGGTRTNVGNANSGAAGGGATLISCRGTVAITGTVDANGGGGSGDFNNVTYRQAGGGGSAGTVVFQGMRVTATGQFFANGGAGGGACNGGCSGGALTGDPGEDGRRSTLPANGGAASGGAQGGRGGTGEFAPNSGLPHPTVPTNGGGGGGSAGYFLTYTPAAGEAVISPAVVSPVFLPNMTIATN